MSVPISLLQIPEIPMKNILEYLDFPSILVLRKTCRDLRKFIDVVKPASGLTQIRVTVELECIHIIVGFNCSKMETTFEKIYYIDYVKNGEGCLVKSNKVDKYTETILENEDFVTLFCKDFNTFFGHQKTELEVFGISFKLPNSAVKERVMESVNKSLKAMNHSLQAKKLEMEVSSHEDIMSILPYIDSKPIETIQITDVLSQYNVVNLNEIGQLEQWKKAEELTIRGFEIPDLAQNVKHFSRISLYFIPISSDSIILLKEIFFCSTTLNTIRITYKFKCSRGVRPLIKTFGQPFNDTNQNKNWFFRIPDINQILRIQLNYVEICFQRIEQSDVPQNVRISN